MAYQTTSNADTYFEGRLHTYSWDDSNPAEKATALEEATARIDRLRFTGDKTVATQDNEFPRDDEAIPDDIKIATCEIAYALLDGCDPERDFAALRHIKEEFASERITYSGAEVPAHLVAGIPSAYAWRFLLPYLDRSGSIILNRTS